MAFLLAFPWLILIALLISVFIKSVPLKSVKEYDDEGSNKNEEVGK